MKFYIKILSSNIKRKLIENNILQLCECSVFSIVSLYYLKIIMPKFNVIKHYDIVLISFSLKYTTFSLQVFEEKVFKIKTYQKLLK